MIKNNMRWYILPLFFTFIHIFFLLFSCSIPSAAAPIDPEETLDAPKIAIVSSGSNYILAGWTTVPEATSYEIWYNTVDEIESAILNESATFERENLSTISNLTSGTIYYVWVRAKSSTSVSPFSPCSSIAFGLIQTPAVPRVTSLLSLGDGQVSLEWWETPGAAAYEVWYNTSTNAASAIQFGEDIIGTSTIVTGLTDGITYYFWLRAKIPLGTSAFSMRSSTVCQTVEPIVFNSWIPGNIVDGNDQLYSVNVISGSYYNFYIDDLSDGSGFYTSDVKIYAYHNNGSQYEYWDYMNNDYMYNNGHAYSVPLRLFAYDTEVLLIKVRGDSGTYALKAVLDKPKAPRLGFGDEKLMVYWTEIPEATSYEVWYNTSSDLDSAIQYGSDYTGTSTTITGLTNGTKYYVWIRAKFEGGILSNFSSYKTGTPLFPQPLEINTWLADNFTSDGSQYHRWYTYNIIEGKSYIISWDEGGSGTRLYTGNIYVRGFHEGASEYFFRTFNDSQRSIVITATSTELLFIEVSRTEAGTYGIKIGIPGLTEAPVLTAGNGELDVSWPNLDGAASYEVWYNTERNSDTAMQFGGVITGNSTTITGLTNGIEYFVWVRALVSGELTDFSPFSAKRPFSALPVAFNTWISGDILEGQILSYSFEAVNGTEYSISWDDYYNGSDTYSCNVFVSAFNDSTNYFIGVGSGYDTPQSVIATESGLIYIVVKAASPSEAPSGTFAIKVTSE